MTRAEPDLGQAPTAEIVDFDAVMLDACPAARRADLLAEARLLADVFAAGADAQALLRMAQQLSAGDRDGEISRAEARLLAAALKRLARDGGVASYQEPHSV